MEHCIFCRIASGEADAKLIYQDEQVVAFRDSRPQAPVHLLLIPRRHVVSLAELGQQDAGLLGHLMLTATRVAREEGLDRDGYRTVINTGANGGQTVFHLHVHVMGGRHLGWPPG